jgi:simple sugar transport system substrate-binding protein
MTIGYLYTGSKNDFGYNQAAAEAAAHFKTDPSLKIVEQENVPETSEVSSDTEDMIHQEDAKAIFATSYGFFKLTCDEAVKNPSVLFFHCSDGLYKAGTTPDNVGTYFAYMDECEYLSGVVAGHMTKSKKLGFIAAKEFPAIRRDVNAFELGAKSVDPSITTIFVTTGDWYLPKEEANAANSLIGQGVDVLTMHVDSPKAIIETAAKAKVYVCGYHSDGTTVAPDYYLTGAEWNWIVPETQLVAMAKSGKITNHTVIGGIKENFVKMSPYGSAVSDAAKKDADAVKAKMLSSEGFVIFKGPLMDNTGKTIYPAGEQHVTTDPVLAGMPYMVAGVIRK